MRHVKSGIEPGESRRVRPHDVMSRHVPMGILHNAISVPDCSESRLLLLGVSEANAKRHFCYTLCVTQTRTLSTSRIRSEGKSRRLAPT